MNNLGNTKKNLLGIQEEENKYYDEKIKINSSDTNDSHTLLANLVSNNSHCLDVGCSVGYIGELLNKEKNCKVYGIEIDKEAIKMAEKKNCYQKIFTFSVTDEKSDEYQKFFSNTLKFDYIIFADILEHLEEPYKVIYKLSKKLNKNGKMLISLPNIAHMDISKNLIDRNFNYNKTGLLDSTHLRFFTKSSFIDMVHNINEQYQTNLQITKVLNTIVIPSYAGNYPNLFKILNQDNELCTLQYIYEITVDSQIKKKIKINESHFYDEIEKNISERNAFLEKIHEQETLINANEQKVTEQTNKIKELNTIQDEMNKELNEKNKELITVQKQVNNALKQTNELQIKLEQILNSKSWKLTKPLRFIKNKIHKK